MINQSAIEAELNKFNRAELRPEQISKFAAMVLETWWFSNVQTHVPSARGGGPKKAQQQLEKFAELASELLKLRMNMCGEAALAIADANASLNFERKKQARSRRWRPSRLNRRRPIAEALTIDDRLQAVTSIAVGAPQAMVKRAEDEKSGVLPPRPPVHNGSPQHVPLNLAKLLAEHYLLLTGQEPTKSNGNLELLARLFDILNVQTFKKGVAQKASAAGYAEQGAKHWQEVRKEIVRWL